MNSEDRENMEWECVNHIHTKGKPDNDLLYDILGCVSDVELEKLYSNYVKAG